MPSPASAEEISALLRIHFTEESILDYQRKLVEVTLGEVVKELHYAMEYRPQDEYYEGFTAATERIDPADVYWSGPYPNEAIDVT